jgi:hypothetical protein
MPAAVLTVVALAIAALAGPTEASAEEYRLRVANLYRESFAHFLDGPIGAGTGELALPRLERALDSGQIDAGALLTDRPLRYAWDELAPAFNAVKVRGFITPAEGGRRWDDAVWEGKPGERSVWLVAPTSIQRQAVQHVALRGREDGATLRYYVPYHASIRQSPLAVIAYPLSFLRFHADRGLLWSRYLAGAGSTVDGIAAIVGVNDNASFADWVYIVIDHPANPTTFKAVVGWDRRWTGDRPNEQQRNP